MPLFQGVVSAAAMVLIVSGAAKLTGPAAAARALLAARLPHRQLLVRALGLAELATGATALTVAGPVIAIVVAAFYAGFDLFIWRRHAVGGTGGCGCFGAAADVTPGAIHLVVNGVFAIAALAAAGGDRSLYDAFTSSLASGAAWTLASAACAALVIFALTRPASAG